MILFNLFFFLYLSLVLLASSIWKGSAWGIDSWGFISQTTGFIFFIILIAAYSLKKFSPEGEAEAAEDTGKPKTPTTRMYILVSISAIALFYILRMKHTYWGELESFAARLTPGSTAHISSPVAVLINRLVFKFLNAVFVLDASSSTVFVSVVSGAIFVIFAIKIVDSLDLTRHVGGFFIPVLFMVSNGYAVVFFGEGGKAPLAVLFVLLYLYYSVRFLRGNASLLGATIFFALALLSQSTCIYLLPSYILLFVFAARTIAYRKGIATSVALIVSAFVVVQFIAPYFYHTSPSVTHILRLSIESLKGSHWAESSYALKNLETLSNGLLLIGPVSVLAVILLFIRSSASKARGFDRYEKNIGYFLSTNVVAALGVSTFSAWNIDQSLNWQILASLSPAFAVFSLWKLYTLFHEKGALKRVIYLVALISVFQTFPWIAVNTHEPFAEKRLLALPLEAGRNELIVAKRYFDEKEFDTAKGWCKKSIEKNPAEKEAYFLLGKIHMHDGQYIDAVGAFTKAVEIDSTSIPYRLSLAEAFIEKSWYDDAINLLNELVTEYPDSVRFWVKLGYAYNHSKHFDEAIGAYERALKLEPQNRRFKTNLVSALLNKGAELQMAGKLDEAKKMYLRAIKLYPRGWRAYNNLATIEIKEGNLDLAEKILKEVLNLYPGSPELNLNMGIVLERENRIEEAIKYMKRSASLSMFPSAIQDTIKALEERIGKK